MKNQTSVLFRVKANTEFSQQIKVCGNISELGNWNPCHAITLVTDEVIYPLWKTEQEISVDRNIIVEFKVLKTTGSTLLWETIPNRLVHVKTSKYIVNCSFDHVEIKIIPIRRLSTGSLVLDQSVLNKAKKCHLSLESDPYDSDFDQVKFYNKLDQSEEGLNNLLQSSQALSASDLEDFQLVDFATTAESYTLMDLENTPSGSRTPGNKRQRNRTTTHCYS